MKMAFDDDSRIRDLFHQLKKEDEKLAPSFGGIVDRTTGADGLWPFRLKLAISVFAMVLLLLPMLMHLYRRDVEPASQIAVDVLEWESPTDFLLTFSEDTLWTTLPELDTEIPSWREERYEE